ncbi:site-specific integrase [Nakamurella sp. A5-74]|uniref:Site-specific integrase n=1 Tax=Nakamurella sp. A5-74 TaxID=3158264 RepID=A0AAU8DTP7_9ACTN
MLSGTAILLIQVAFLTTHTGRSEGDPRPSTVAGSGVEMPSIRERIRTRDGVAVYAVLWREDGKQTSMAFPGDKQAALNFKRMLEANDGDAAVAGEMLRAIDKRSPAVSTVVEKHIATLPSVSARTKADCRRDALNHITPYLGHVPVSAITKDRVGEWLAKLASKRGPAPDERNEGPLLLSVKTIANVHGLLSSAIAAAVDRRHLAANPCKGVRLPRRSEHESQEMVFLTPTEWQIIDGELGVGVYSFYRPLFRTLINTGMRWGEVGAMRPRDLNLRSDDPSISIMRALKRDENSRSYIGPTKTRRFRRTISIPVDLAEQLRELTVGKGAEDLLFTTRTGSMLNPSHERTRVWLPAVRRAQDVEKYGDRAVQVTPRIHDLRHSHASWLIAAGVDLLTVQRRLGHESITTTADRYSHLLPGQQRAASAAIAAALSG